jgi:uncharacterized membrane protein
MRGLLFLIYVFLLAGCSREERTASIGREKGASAESAIAHELVRDDSTSPSHTATAILTAAEPGRIPVPSPPSSESRYRAIGAEPFWSVLVKGSTATLERPDKEPVHYPISRDDDGRTIRYLGDGFTMSATEGPCSDGMSDAVWSDRVTLAFGEGTLKGCGGVRSDL